MRFAVVHGKVRMLSVKGRQLLSMRTKSTQNNAASKGSTTASTMVSRLKITGTCDCCDDAIVQFQIGMVVAVPRRKIERCTSLNEIRNPKVPAPTIPGRRIGISMSQNVRQPEAPRSAGASATRLAERGGGTNTTSRGKGDAQTT